MNDEPEQLAALRARVAALEGELALTQSASARLDAVLSAVPSIVMHLDADLRILDISRVVAGYTLESVVGSDFLMHVPEGERLIVETTLRSVLATKKPTTYSTVGPGPDGAISMYESYVAALTSAKGATELIVVSIDITQRRQRDEALRERELLLSVACDATGIGLWVWDVDTDSVTWNVAMHTLTGVDRPLSLVAYSDRLVHPDDRALVQRPETFLTTKDHFQTNPHRIVRPDGKVRWVVTSGRVHRTDAGVVDTIIGATLDVTAHRDAESTRSHGERLAAVGRLAAGIAHNFNNHLSTILPVLEMVRIDERTERLELVDDAIHAGRRSADLVRQLLAFARQRDSGVLKPELFESVIERATAMCKSLLDRSVSLSFESRAKDAFVVCDSGAIEQAVLNLVVNARDAIAENGRGLGHVRVSLDLENDDKGESVVLRISDDGAGIEPAVRDRIFEPFFTTKDPGRGTGLGLSITYAAIEAHGGSIRCESTLGVGTTFVLRFPTTRAQATTKAETGPHDSLRARPMRILLCDDDDGVRDVVSTWLDHMGHEVATASAVGEAIDSLSAGPGRDLILLDRSLLGTDPRTSIARMRDVSPSAFVVFFSGDDVPDDELVLVDHVLAKPPSARSMDAMLEALFGT